MRSSLWTAVMGAIAMTLAFCGADKVEAADANGFTARDLRGTCALDALAFPDAGGTEAVIGLFTFDGRGGVTATIRLNVSAVGVTPFVPGAGTYQVNPDGTGVLTLSVGPQTIQRAFTANAKVTVLKLLSLDPGLPGVGTCNF